MHKIVSALASGFILFSLSTAAVVARQITLHDVQELIQVSDPHFSPDGRQVVYVVARPDIAGARMDAQLAIVDVSTRAIRALTYGRKGVLSPRWSPDGRELAFIARESDADEDHDQIFLMPMQGGDARQISHADNDVEQFAWKPDGSAIAYVVADVSKDKDRIKKHHDGFEVHANDYLTTQAPTSSHVWIIARDGGRARRLTHGSSSVSVVSGGDESPLAWSPDGRKIAMRIFPDPYYGDADGAHIVILDVASGAVRRVSDHAGLESDPQFAPGGDALAYQMPKLGLRDNGQDIFLTSPSGGNGRDITASLDRTIAWYRWLPGGNALLAAAADHASIAMWRMDRNGNAQRLDLGEVMMDSDGDVAPNGAVAFVGESTKRPVEIYVLPAGGGAPQPLTHYNRSVSALELGDAREVTWRGPGGFEEDGILTYPPHWMPARKYPLVLVIHGGPDDEASILGFGDLNQLLAAHGYFVFEPNYRASINLGDAYERAIIGDTGDGPGKDIMAGIAAVERDVTVDTQRIGVSGWSYGGFMTSWLEGHYTIWKAAVAGAALNDWLLDYDISWYVNRDLFYFRGPPYVGLHAQAWRTQSPIEYVRNIKTPTLILADVYDANVPIVNSYEMFRALQVQHVPVKFIAYPIQPHFPDDPVHLTDVYREWIGWMDAHLR